MKLIILFIAIQSLLLTRNLIQATYPQEFGQSTICDTFLNVVTSDRADRLLVAGQTTDTKLIYENNVPTGCSSSSFVFVAYYYTETLQFTRFFKSGESIEWVGIARADLVANNFFSVFLKLGNSLKFFITIEINGTINYVHQISNANGLATLSQNTVAIYAPSSIATTKTDYQIIFPAQRSSDRGQQKLGVEILMVNDNYKYQTIKTTGATSRKFLPITALAIDNDGFLAYGAQYLSDPNNDQSHACPVVGLMALTLAQTSQVFSLASSDCTTNTKNYGQMDSIYTDNQGYFYGVAMYKEPGTSIPVLGRFMTLFGIKYDPSGSNIGCYQATMSTIPLSSSNTFVSIFQLMAADSAQKTVDVWFDQYSTVSDYDNKIIDETIRVRLRNLIDTTCDTPSSEDINQGQSVQLVESYSRYCPPSVICQRQNLLRVTGKKLISVIQSSEFGNASPYSTPYAGKQSIMIYQPTITLSSVGSSTVDILILQFDLTITGSEGPGSAVFNSSPIEKNYVLGKQQTFTKIDDIDLIDLGFPGSVLIDAADYLLGAFENKIAPSNLQNEYTDLTNSIAWKFNLETSSKNNVQIKFIKFQNNQEKFVFYLQNTQTTYQNFNLVQINFQSYDCSNSNNMITQNQSWISSESWGFWQTSARYEIKPFSTTHIQCAIQELQIVQILNSAGASIIEESTATGLHRYVEISPQPTNVGDVFKFQIKAYDYNKLTQLDSTVVTITIVQCGLETLSLSQPTYEITLEREIGKTFKLDLSTDIYKLFISSDNVQCPVTIFSLVSAYTQFSFDLGTSIISIDISGALEVEVDLKSEVTLPSNTILSANQDATLKLKIEVCGNEKLFVQDARNVVIVQMIQTDQSFIIQNVQDYFTLSSLNNKCVMKSIGAFQDSQGQIPIGKISTSSQNKIDLKIDLSIAQNEQTNYLIAITSGLVHSSKKLILSVCEPFSQGPKLLIGSDVLKNQQYIIQKTDYDSLFIQWQTKCTYCKIGSYKLTSTAQEVSMNDPSLGEITVSIVDQDVKATVEISAIFQDAQCQTVFGNDAKIEIQIEYETIEKDVVKDIQTCKNEMVIQVSNIPEEVDFNQIQDIQFTFKKDEIQSLFKVESNLCTFGAFQVSWKQTSFEPVPEEFSKVISINKDLVVSNLGNSSVPFIEFFVQSLVSYQFTISKKFQVVFKPFGKIDEEEKALKPKAKDNKSPEFKVQFLPIILIDLISDLSTSVVMSINGLSDTYSVALPSIIDLESDSITLKGQTLSCNQCFEFLKESSTQYVIQINQENLMKSTGKEYTIKLKLFDDKSKHYSEYEQKVMVYRLEKETKEDDFQDLEIPAEKELKLEPGSDQVMNELDQELTFNYTNQNQNNQKKRKKTGDLKFYKPIILRIDKFNRNGILKIYFKNSDQFPEDSDFDLRRRQLYGQGNSFKFKLLSSQKLNYTVSVSHITQHQLDLKFWFTEPLKVSQREYDYLQILIGNSKLLESMIHPDASIAIDSKVMVTKIPRQFPEGFDSDAVNKQAKQVADSLNGLIIIQLISQIFLKGSLDQLWSLFFTTQMIVYLEIYKVPISSFSEIYVLELRKLLEFNILNPDGLLKLIDPDLNLDEILKDQLLKDLQIYIMLVLLFIAGIIFIIPFLLIPSLKEKVKAKLVKIMDQTFWNGIIRSIMISYLPTCISLCNEDHIKPFSDQFVGTGALLSFIMLASFVFMKMNNKNLRNDEFKLKYEKLYEGVAIRNPGSIGIYYTPVFFLRRLIYTTFPIVFFHQSVFQIQGYLFLTKLYIIWYHLTRPHFQKSMRRLLTFNEVFIMLMNYELICFSDFNQSLMAKFQMGFSQVGLIGILILFNIIFVVSNFVNKVLKIRKLKQKIKNFQKSAQDKIQIDQIKIQHMLKKVKVKSQNGYIRRILSKGINQQVLLFQVQCDYSDQSECSRIMSTIREASEDDSLSSQNESYENVIQIKQKKEGTSFQTFSNLPALKRMDQYDFKTPVQLEIQEVQLQQKENRQFPKQLQKRAKAGYTLKVPKRSSKSFRKHQLHYQRQNNTKTNEDFSTLENLTEEQELVQNNFTPSYDDSEKEEEKVDHKIDVIKRKMRDLQVEIDDNENSEIETNEASKDKSNRKIDFQHYNSLLQVSSQSNGEHQARLHQSFSLHKDEVKKDSSKQARLLNLKKMKRKQAMFQKHRVISMEARGIFYAQKQKDFEDNQDLDIVDEIQSSTNSD